MQQVNSGSGEFVTLQPGAGVTFRPDFGGPVETRGPGSSITALKVAPNTWQLTGDIRAQYGQIEMADSVYNRMSGSGPTDITIQRTGGFSAINAGLRLIRSAVEVISFDEDIPEDEFITAPSYVSVDAHSGEAIFSVDVHEVLAHSETYTIGYVFTPAAGYPLSLVQDFPTEPNFTIVVTQRIVWALRRAGQFEILIDRAGPAQLSDETVTLSAEDLSGTSLANFGFSPSLGVITIPAGQVRASVLFNYIGGEGTLGDTIRLSLSNPARGDIISGSRSYLDIEVTPDLIDTDN